jgi:hypothetical protein
MGYCHLYDKEVKSDDKPDCKAAAISAWEMERCDECGNFEGAAR